MRLGYRGFGICGLDGVDGWNLGFVTDLVDKENRTFMQHS